MTLSTMVAFLPEAQHSKVRKETRLQLWCELFVSALGIINHLLRYQGHKEVTILTKVLKET